MSLVALARFFFFVVSTAQFDLDTTGQIRPLQYAARSLAQSLADIKAANVHIEIKTIDVLNMTPWLERQLRVCKCIMNCTCDIKNWFCDDTCMETCNCFKRGFHYCDARREAVTILAFAGKDVSHWFKGDEWIHYTHPVVGSRVPYYRHGAGSRRPVVPSTRWRPMPKPWWLDETLVVGKFTEKTRPIRIVNTMTGHIATLEVCSEETLYQVMMRYLPHNSHMLSYTWRYLGRPLCLNRTLEQNGIVDERAIYHELGIPDNFHIPAILIYYNDDLTEDAPFDKPHNLWIEKCECFDEGDCTKKAEEEGPETSKIINYE